MKYCSLLFLGFVIYTTNAFAQKEDTIEDLERLLDSNAHGSVYTISKARINQFIAAGNADTLQDYVNYLGIAASKIKNDAAAKTELLAVVKKVTDAFPYHPSLINLYLNAASFFSNQGNHDLAYQLTKQLDDYFLNNRSGISKQLTVIQSNLGDFSMRSGKFGVATGHYLKSIELLKLDPKPDAQKMYFANNSLGIIMWYTSKLDSAVYYFSKAVDALKTMDSTPHNRFFRVALVQNNIAGCYNVMGKTKEAISMFESVIDNYKKFIASPQPNPKKENAKINQFQSVDNLAKVYLDLGDFSKAYDFLQYSYQQKLANFGDKSPEVYKSLVFLGTVKNNQHQYKVAIGLLEDALNRIRALGGTDNSWAAEAHAQLAIANRELKNNDAAAANFKEANQLYELVYAGQYDDLYLSYLYDMSLFYTSQQQPQPAISSITQGLNYVIKAQGENSLGTVLQLTNLADVYYRLQQYSNVKTTAARAITAIDKLSTEHKELLDSIRITMQKPKLMLLEAKAGYELLPNKDTASIATILNNLYQAKNILDQRKTIFTDEKDINILVADNKELLDFIEQLTLELYNKTGNRAYLDKAISLHESGMYARIRSRMDKQHAIRFSGIPATVIEQENQLKQAIQQALNGPGSYNEKLNTYLTAVSKWKDFQATLKKQYPVYYNMRYASRETTLEDIRKILPGDITVIKYFFAAKQLFALVADQKKQELFTLSSHDLEEQVNSLIDSKSSEEQVTAASYALYQQLWKPFEKQLSNQRIVIIPDGILYNISFDMLTPTATASFTKMSAECLLHKYAISYHYSLLAMEQEKKATPMKDNFIGFTPVFSDEQKKEYSSLLKTDSLHIDNNYLTLLPLPFTISLAKKLQNNLGGELFSMNESTPEAFKNKAGNHSVIYIGTHAESNNSNPEYSRLIFSKDLQNREQENSLYLFDIYNCNLSSQLSVLTACETGKPGYQDGEGMISMAHAFNYAGSESILTGLWKIDEQTSTVITEKFYHYLQDGLSKDVALQKAKLDYLKNSNGRMLAPQYWAGLVIMGDTAAVTFKPNFSRWWYAGGIGACLLGIVFVVWRRRTAARKQ